MPTLIDFNQLSFPKLNISFQLPRGINILGFNIYFYGLMIALGFLLALLYAYKNAKKFGIDFDKLLDVALLATAGGIVCARIYYVVFSWQDYKDNLLSVFKIWEGGLAIYGGIVGGFVVGYFACKWRKVSFLPAADLASIGFLIGQSFGRWGNFFNIEAYGNNTSLPWGMTSPKIASDIAFLSDQTINPNLPVHPCFLYESLWCFLGFLLLSAYVKKRKFDGEILILYCGFYGLGRFFIEGLRTDSLMIGPLRVSQILALLLVIAAVVLWITANKLLAKNNKFLKLHVNQQNKK